MKLKTRKAIHFKIFKNPSFPNLEIDTKLDDKKLYVERAPQLAKTT